MKFPMVPLNQVLRRFQEPLEIDPTATYKQITVRLHHQGVILRGIQQGAGIGSSRQFKAREGQLILSRIDARNGAIGLVPAGLDGAIVTNDFWLFEIDEDHIVPTFLDYYVGTSAFIDLCRQASEGTTNRVRLQPDAFIQLPVPIPPLSEQRQIVERVEAVAEKVAELRGLRRGAAAHSQSLLHAVFHRLTAHVKWIPMSDVAPLVRRPVRVEPLKEYAELGIRSFGKGTFHKMPVQGHELGSKRVFHIYPGDLVFSNVFAWEGAVAVATPEDAGRIGSHRFITCVPNEGLTTAKFLRFHFLTQRGLKQLGDASPGGAGRNRTLGLSALEQIDVPAPGIDAQQWFDKLQDRFEQVNQVRAETELELEALLPSILDRALRGEL
jgi:type I restriction enzyme, S subunit